MSMQLTYTYFRKSCCSVKQFIVKYNVSNVLNTEVNHYTLAINLIMIYNSGIKYAFLVKIGACECTIIFFCCFFTKEVSK